MPEIAPEVKAAVKRLRTLRREVKALETEEALLRNLILTAVGHWPPDRFPIRVDEVELQVQSRPGRIDEGAARAILEDAGRLQAAPVRLVVNPDGAAAFDRQLESLGLPVSTLKRVRALYAEVVRAEPAPTPGFLDAEASAGHLTPDQYRDCFQKGRPKTPVLVLR
jgi:hypothetical protein